MPKATTFLFLEICILVNLCSGHFFKFVKELQNSHVSLMEEIFEPKSYEILYSYTHLLNGFAVKLVDSLQVSKTSFYIVSFECLLLTLKNMQVTFQNMVCC